MAIQPEDILADDVNEASLNNVTIRKGSIAAALANAEIITSETSDEHEKQEATQVFLQLIKQIHQTTFSKHLSWKDPIIRKIIEESKND